MVGFNVPVFYVHTQDGPIEGENVRTEEKLRLSIQGSGEEKVGTRLR